MRYNNPQNSKASIKVKLLTVIQKNGKLFLYIRRGSDFSILEAHACSDVGMCRSENQENLYFNGLIKEEASDNFSHYEEMKIKNGRAVFGVFDGMGGYLNGEHAAFITADCANAF